VIETVSVIASVSYYVLSNFAQSVINSSVRGIDYLLQISSKSIQYSWKAKGIPMVQGTINGNRSRDGGQKPQQTMQNHNASGRS